MNKNITLALAFILSCLTHFGQGKLDYEKDSRWFWGLNLGGTWHTTDVKNQNDLGFGLVLGKSFNYDYGKRLSFDLRGRYLYGNWKGQDVDTTGFERTNAALSQGATDYKNTLGYSVLNFNTRVHRLSLELVLHANRIRERSGWDPYIFGGAGITFYQTMGNQLNEDSIVGSQMYDYDKLPDYTRSTLNGIQDETYETALDGSSAVKYNAAFMPSIGFGLGYQMGPRFSMGFEHKTTFTRLDNFDGFNNPTGARENDLYHYTSVYMRFQVRKSTGGGTVTGNGNGTENQFPPEVVFTNPNTSGQVVTSPNFGIKAVVKFVNGRDNINFRQNGVYNGSFIYDPNTDKFESQVILQPGQNVFEIIASNAYGTDQETTIIIYRQQQEAPPVVTYINPASNPQTTSSPTFNLTASVLNVQNASQINMNVNGQQMSNFNFNPSNGNLTQTLNLVIGSNVVTITGTNSVGSDTETTTIIYNPVNNVQPPVVYFVDPNVSPYTTNNGTYTINADVLNVSGRENITFKQNGSINQNFTYNANSDDFQSSVILVPGQNVFEIIATNTAGVAQATTIIIYERIAPRPPVVTITNPPTTPYQTENNLFSLSATVLNVTTASQVQLTLNGQNISNFSFDPSNGHLSMMLNLIEGSNTIVVRGTNNDGTDSKQVIIIYKTPVKPLPPVVTFTVPSSNPYVSEVQSMKVTATVLNVDQNSGINVNINGSNFTGFNFNQVTKVLSFQLNLIEGANVVVVTGTNSVGVDSKSTTIIYKKPQVVLPPVVTFVDPLLNPLTVYNQNYALVARVQHVAGAQNIQLKINGTLTNSFAYNASTESMTFNSGLLVGANIFEITATNAAGQDSKSTTIIYKASEPLLPPVVTITVPLVNPYTTSSSSTAIEASILNIENSQNIQVLVNNMNFTAFTYNNVTKKLTMNMNLIEGSNTLTIKATNAAGQGMDTRTIIYKKEVIVQPPFVTFINPNQPGLTVNNANYVVKANIQNIENASQIVLTQNGQVVNPSLYSFNPGTKELSFNTGLNLGNNIFTIQATNSAGTHSATTSIIYQLAVVPCDKPVLTFLLPNASGIEIAQSNNAVKIKALNVTSVSQITVLLNGVVQAPGSFNGSNKIYDLNVNYTLGQNIIEVIATNDCGETKISTIVIYKQAGQPCQAPSIQMISPDKKVSIVEDASMEIKASILNVASASDIVFKVNGEVKPFAYDNTLHVLIAQISLKDGLNSVEIQCSNDCGSAGTDLKITKKICEKPAITIASSSVPNNGSTIQETFTINGSIAGITESSQFSITLNGVVSNYVFDAAQKTFSWNTSLVLGVNTIVLKARNNCGIDEKTIKITRNADPTAVPPVVHITNPSVSPYNTTVGAFNVQATTQNVTSASQVSMTVNGNTVNANFNTGNGSLSYNLTLSEGANVIVVSAANQHGSSTDTKTIVYTKPVVVEKPVIVLIQPGSCPAILPAGINQIKGHILNITDLNQVSIQINGVNVQNFNPVLQNGKLNFQFDVNLSSGNNNLQLLITAQNQGGSDSKSCVLKMEEVVVDNCIPTVSAIFATDSKSVTTNSTKDLSNVVLKYYDGSVQKFDGLSGLTGTFSGTGTNAGKCIIGVWIKSGCNQSNDGPGYGEWVANTNPTSNCASTTNNGGTDGGCMPVVGATFATDSKSVTATSTKDLSNVVLKYFDGTVQKFDGLTGLTGTFSGTGQNAGKCIVGIWIKSGCNDSGDGPGYGEWKANNSSMQNCVDQTDGRTDCLPTVGATFSVDSKTVIATSTKELINVVLKYFDGVEQKFDGLSGTTITLQGTGANAGKCISGVWIKSGCNESTDGPNYGEWKANPANTNNCVVGSGKGNNGHGNNEDGVDESNPGQGQGGPNGGTNGTVDDESGKGGNTNGGNNGGNKARPTGGTTNGSGTNSGGKVTTPTNTGGGTKPATGTNNGGSKTTPNTGTNGSGTQTSGGSSTNGSKSTSGGTSSGSTSTGGTKPATGTKTTPTTNGGGTTSGGTKPATSTGTTPTTTSGGTKTTTEEAKPVTPTPTPKPKTGTGTKGGGME